MLPIDRRKAEGSIFIKIELIDGDTPEFGHHNLADQFLELDRIHQIIHHIHVFVVDRERQIGVFDGVDTFIDGVGKHAIQQDVAIQVVELCTVTVVSHTQCGTPRRHIVNGAHHGLHDDLRRDGASGGLFMLRFIAH